MSTDDVEESKNLLDTERAVSLFPSLRVTRTSHLSEWLADHVKVFVTSTVLLAVTNLITLALLLFNTQIEPDVCSVAVNWPPRGVTPSLAHLASPLAHRLENVTFYDYDHSIWRMHESVEGNEAWLEYAPSRAGYLILPEDEAEQAELDPTKHAFINAPELGLRGYPVMLEAVHQMHCVDLLRKYSYLEVDHTRKTCDEDCDTPPEYIAWHIDHCVELLRVSIACTADLNLIPFFWLGTEGRLTGDFGRTHSCGNYEVIRRYTADMATRAPFEGKVRPKPGDYWVPDYI